MSGVEQNNSPDTQPGESNGMLQEPTRTDLPGDPKAWNHWVSAPGPERDQTIDFPKPGQDRSPSDIRSNLQVPQSGTIVASAASSPINPSPAYRGPAQQHRSPSVSTPPLQPGFNQQETRWPILSSPLQNPTSPVSPRSPSPPVAPGVVYPAQTSFTPSPMVPSSGPSAYFSPPASGLPTHMRRGQKSAPGSQSPSMLQEWFSADNSPAYDISRLTPGTPGTNLTELESEAGREPDQDTSLERGVLNNPLFNGRSRLKGTPATWTDHAGTEFKFPSLVAWHLTKNCSPQDAENALSDLLRATGKEQVDQDWIHALRSSESLLHGLFRLSDLVTPVESLLNPKSPCAKIIDLLLKHYNVDDILIQIHRSDIGGVTALRYLICKARSVGSPPGESYESKPKDPWAPDIAVHHAHRIADWSGIDSLGMIPAIRLVESVLPSVHTLDRLQQPVYRTFLEAAIQLIKHIDLDRPGERLEVDPARRTAALHLVSSTLRTYKSILDRLEGDSDTPTMPNKEWILQDLGISDILPYVRDEDSHPLVRCMALRVLRDFANVDVDEVPRWGQLDNILTICVDVLLWQTKWQHGHEATSKSLDIAKFCPHDDAYRIITLSPAGLVIPILSRSLKAVDTIALLEPLLSLIVDHSKLKDKYWPFMLSMLLHSGCLSLFHDILLRPFPAEKDSLYRTTCRAKADACIGLTRCFEQMRAKDIKLIPSNTAATLAKLANDEKLPSSLRGRASDAFGALRENVIVSLDLQPQVVTRLDDSAAQLPHPTSTSSMKYQSKHTGLVPLAAGVPQSASQPMSMAVPIEDGKVPRGLNRTRLRPLAEAIHKGILKKREAKFTEPDDAVSPPPQVKFLQYDGQHGEHKSSSTLMYTGYGIPGPSSDPFPVTVGSSLDSPSSATEPHAPQDFQTPTFQTSATAVATTISTFDKDSKTPPIIFEPLSSDRFSIYIPSSRGPGYHSLEMASPASPYHELPEGGELVDVEGTTLFPSWPVSDAESTEPLDRTPSSSVSDADSTMPLDRTPSSSVSDTDSTTPLDRTPPNHESMVINTPRDSVRSITEEDEPALSLPLPLLRYHLHLSRNHR